MQENVIDMAVSAIECDDIGEFNKIVKHFGDTNGVPIGPDGQTFLMCAAHYGATKIGHRLIDLGAKVDAVDIGGHTALMFASASGSLEIVVLLLDSTEDISQQSIDELPFTALMAAAMNGQIAVMERLIGAGANVCDTNRFGLTALHFAVMNGYLEAAQLLIANGVPIDASSTDGRTALYFAFALPNDEPQREEIIEFLMDNGADGNKVMDRGTPR